jgi:hypothetical protein
MQTGALRFNTITVATDVGETRSFGAPGAQTRDQSSAVCILGALPHGCCIRLLSALGYSDALQLMKLIMGFELLPDSCDVKDNARRDIAVFKPVKDLIDRG